MKFRLRLTQHTAQIKLLTPEAVVKVRDWFGELAPYAVPSEPSLIIVPVKQANFVLTVLDDLGLKAVKPKARRAA